MSLTSIDDRIRKLMKVLSSLEPHKQHRDIKMGRLDHTGTWLLQLDCFRRWSGLMEWSEGAVDENSSILCCYGIPGAGKTMIRYYYECVR